IIEVASSSFEFIFKARHKFNLLPFQMFFEKKGRLPKLTGILQVNSCLTQKKLSYNDEESATH
ncbi:hypothetical protein V7122_17325, partial [Bacillus sp. JJ1532]